MTYILKVWEPPGPPRVLDDIAPLLAAVSALEEGPSRPSRRFAPLLRHLTRRYPDITSPEASELAEAEWAWTDGPLADSAEETVMVLGLRAQQVEPVRRFVIEQATGLGLAVLDPQAGAAWFPGGVQVGLEAPGRPRAPSAASARLNCGATALLLFDALSPGLAAAGFKPARSRRRWRRTDAAGWQEVILMTEDHGRGACGFFLMATFRLHAIAELHARLFLPALPEKERQLLPTVALRQGDWLPEGSSLVAGGHRDYYIKEPSQVAPLAQQVVADCAAYLLPLLDAGRSVEGLDQLLNPEPLDRSVFFRGYDSRLDAHVWAAYLARNPRLEALCEQVLANIRGESPAHGARTCVDYVRAHPLAA